MLIFKIILAVLAVLGNLGDWYTSVKDINSGAGTEANPVMKWLFSKLTMNGTFAIKCFIMLLLSIYLVMLSFGWIPLLILVVMYGWVTYHNWKV